MMTQLLTVNTNDALLEVDHLQIYLEEGLPAIIALKELGLNNGDQIVRREERGTASTLFFFENAYIELIWLENQTTFRQYAAQTKLNLWERSQWKRTGASPFGVGLRSKSSGEISPHLLINNPFGQIWGYPEATINFSADNVATIQEPICFTVPNQIALTNWLDSTNIVYGRLMTHPLNIRRLTDIKIRVNTVNTLTNALSLLEENQILTIERGTSPLLTLTFDDNAQHKIFDAHPILPIQILY
jgi:hypothetical protein